MRIGPRRVLVQGASMAPALRHGDQVLVLFARRPTAVPGQVVVVELPDGTTAVKRLTRRDGADRVWVEGDNPFGSTDSRTLGDLPAEAVLGRVLFRLWPQPGYVRSSHGDPRYSPSGG
jgi:nickel-type superoxide dismutase maturation protease